MSEGPSPEALGPLVAEHLGPILYALEVCAKAMENADRQDDVRYYRALARQLARAGAGQDSPE